MEFNDTITGIIIGAAFTAIGFIYKKRLENLATLKRSLYQLLILYRSVNSTTIVKPAEAAKWTLEVLHELFPDSVGGEELKGAEELYSGIFSSILNSSILSSDGNLVPMYLEAVENISSIHPVLAYRLSGNAELKKYLLAADHEVCKFRENAEKELSPKDKAIVQSMHSHASLEAAKEVTRELRTDLLILSLKCGIFQFIAVARKVFARKETADEEKARIKAELKLFIEKAIAQLSTET